MLKRSLAVAAAATLGFLTGCPQNLLPPTFTPGDTADIFGQLDDRIGNLFDIQITEDGEVQIVASGEGGDATFTLDEQGRLSAANGGNGTDVDLTYNDDGTVSVAGTFVDNGQAMPFEGTIPAGILPNGKGASAQLLDLEVCGIINEFCAAWPDVFDAILAAAFDNLGELDLPGNAEAIEFPTGNRTIDELIRDILRSRLALLYQIDAFCNAWSNADQDEICGSE